MSRTLLTLVCQHSRSRPTRDPSGFTSPLRSRGRWHVVLTSVFHERIRARTERMCQPSFVLLLLEVTLRSTFQRSRGIIVKRLSPFSLERPGFTSGSPPARPSLSLAALPHQSLTAFTLLAALRSAQWIVHSLRELTQEYCARHSFGVPHGLATTQRAPVAHANYIVSTSLYKHSLYKQSLR